MASIKATVADVSSKYLGTTIPKYSIPNEFWTLKHVVSCVCCYPCMRAMVRETFVNEYDYSPCICYPVTIQSVKSGICSGHLTGEQLALEAAGDVHAESTVFRNCVYGIAYCIPCRYTIMAHLFHDLYSKNKLNVVTDDDL